MSNKGWTTIYHWICPITPPFSLLPTETTVCALQLACDCWGAGRPCLWTISVASWPMLARPGAWGTFVRQTAFGTSRWSSSLQNAPQLMEWDTTVTTWPSTAPMNRPAVLPCVTYGSVGRPTTTLKPVLLGNVMFFCVYFLFYTISDFITASQSTIWLSHVALQVADSPNIKDKVH